MDRSKAMANSIESPDGLELRAKPKISARLNKKAVFIGVGGLIIIVLIIVANVSKPAAGVAKKSADEKSQQVVVPAISAGKSLIRDVSDKPVLMAPADLPAMPKNNESKSEQG